jgi:methionyl-tRNA formyltransferase
MSTLPICFLAANTKRSMAYAQLMRHKRIHVAQSILFFDSEPQTDPLTKEKENSADTASGVYTTDFSEPLIKTLTQISDTVLELSVSNINDRSIFNAISNDTNKFLIYSGYGGQIVKSPLIDSTIPLLHVHSGWLPQFRGSTTIYYHMLATDYCGVSVIQLKKDIDTGPILWREKYPLPSGSIDIDYKFDTEIRARTLLKVLEYFKEKGSLPEPLFQKKEEGETYYIIHPVLKHISILGNAETRKKSL